MSKDTSHRPIPKELLQNTIPRRIADSVRRRFILPLPSLSISKSQGRNILEHTWTISYAHRCTWSMWYHI